MQAVSERDHIIITFEPFSQPGITHYEYAVNSDQDTDFLLVSSVEQTMFAIPSQSNVPVDVYLRAVFADSWKSAAVKVTGRPYLVPSAPVIQSVDSILHGLVIRFSPSREGFPEHYSYQYSVDDGVTYDWAPTPLFTEKEDFLQITVHGLCEPRPYHISLRAVNTAGTSLPSNTIVATPFVKPIVPPQIEKIESVLNGVKVHFSPSQQSWPAIPTSYLYSLDNMVETNVSNSGTFIDTGCTDTPIVVAMTNRSSITVVVADEFAL